jgi:hypothetical protein
LLERQLILKGVCTTEDWTEWKQQIDFDFAVDNYFEELKLAELNRDRVGLAREMEEYVGKYYSHEYMRRYVLQHSEAEIEEIDKQIAEEKTDERYVDPEELEQDEPEPEPAPSPAGQSFKLVPDDDKDEDAA